MKALTILLVFPLLLIACQASATTAPTVEPSYLSINWVQPETVKTLFQTVEPPDMNIPPADKMATSHAIELVDEQGRLHKIVIEQDGRNQGRVIIVALYYSTPLPTQTEVGIISTIVDESGTIQNAADFELVVAGVSLTSDKEQHIQFETGSDTQIELFTPLSWKCADFPPEAYAEDTEYAVRTYGKVCFPPESK